MPLFEWNDRFNLNNEEIDNQHRMLFTLLDKLYKQLLSDNNDLAPTMDILDGLVNYTKIHFLTEEKLFASAGYPDAEKHIIEHRNFIRKIVSFKDDVKSGKSKVDIKIMRFLKQWLEDHINGMDRHFFRKLVS